MSIVFAALAALSTPVTPVAVTDAQCLSVKNRADGPDIKVTKSAPVRANGDMPEYCQVQGMIKPNIGFEARLPLKSWNGKYLQTGCGGFCGILVPDKTGRSNSINYALIKGYATLTTDGGHQTGSNVAASWAANNMQAQEVYAYKGIKLSYDAGLKLVEALYDRPPAYRYFSGCSNGGRMAAMAAQRYPSLFHGIIAGCGVMNLSATGGIFGAWILQANMDKDGKPVLDSDFVAKLPFLEKEARKQCDAIDGEEDGLISKPEACKIDVSQMPKCGNAGGDNCLTAAEAKVVAAWYQGPRNSSGKQLFSGMPPGSERYWAVWHLGKAQSADPYAGLAGGYLRYLAFPKADPGYAVTQFDFDKDIKRLAQKGKLFNATDPDLTRFKAAGGKMIMWHGAADPLVLPQNSIDYYNGVVAKMGGAEKVGTFLRFFTAPGLGHCWELPSGAPEDFDLLAALEKWVETGIAPDAIPAAQYDEKGSLLRKGNLLPYPLTAKFMSVPANAIP